MKKDIWFLCKNDISCVGSRYCACVTRISTGTKCKEPPCENATATGGLVCGCCHNKINQKLVTLGDPNVF